jgi:HEAT repeat protein
MALVKLRSDDLARRRQAAIRFARAAKGRRLPEAAWQRAQHVLAGEADGQVRRLLTERLFEAGHEGLADALVHGLKLSDVRARRSAALYLGRLKSPKAVPHLVECLRDERTSVQHAAAWALGQIGDPAAVEPLKRSLMTRELSGRLAFAAALARLGDAAGREELVRLMLEGKTSMQVQVAEAMAEVPHVDYVATIIEKLDPRNPRLAAALTAALRKITGQDFGYRPQASSAVRKKALGDWRAWFTSSQQIRIPAAAPR